MALFNHLLSFLVVVDFLLLVSVTALPIEQCLAGQGSCRGLLKTSIALPVQEHTRGIHGQAISFAIIGGTVGLTVVALGLYLLLRQYKSGRARRQPTRGVLPGPRLPTGATIDLEIIRAYGPSDGAPASPRASFSSTTGPLSHKRHAIIEGPPHLSWPAIKDQVETAMNREDALRMLTGEIPAPSEAHVRDDMFMGLVGVGISVEELEVMYQAYALQRGGETYVLLDKVGRVIGGKRMCGS